MLSLNEALALTLRNVKALPTEIVPLEVSLGRELGEDVVCKMNLPPFSRSSMDGFALHKRDLKNLPVLLKNIGTLQAGDFFSKTVNPKECVKIMTGAALPRGTDCVIPIENTQVIGGFVKPLKQVKKNENVRLVGEDIKKGTLILKKGIGIQVSHIPLLASVGKYSIRTRRKPRVVLLNTGSELVPIGEKLRKNKIYNSNGPMLEALLKSDGITVASLGTEKDRVLNLKKAILRGLRSDMLILSGGVSVGEFDLVPKLLSELSVKKIFHKVRIKPGKPLFFGKKSKTVVFGLPGNPLSSYLNYFLFIRPVLFKMIGYRGSKPNYRSGILLKDFHQNKINRTHFVLVGIKKKGAYYYLNPIRNNGSADLGALSKAQGFMVVDEKIEKINKNGKVYFITWLHL